MDYFKIGKLVNTHALKGEVKIISELRANEAIYKLGNTLYIGDDKLPFVIESYRRHKQYDMIKFKSLNTIDHVLPYKGSDVFIKIETVNDNFIEILLDYDVYNNDVYIGKVIEILKGVKNDFIVVSDDRIIIPFIDNFIINIDKENKVITTSYML